jgi:hypothetical protein
MNKTIVAALLTCAGACFAQPPGITREVIERALPVEGAPFAEPGQYKVTCESAFGSPGNRVFRPATLEVFPKKDRKAGAMFVGNKCGLRTNSNWDARSKAIK